jgi:phenylacetic acid degradation protein
MFPGKRVLLEASAHIGHGAVIHGARIGQNSLIGMNSVIMDEVDIGEECIVGALSFIKAGERFERRSLIAGNPARYIREVSDEMAGWKTEGTRLYQQLAEECQQFLVPCQPLTEVPENRPVQPEIYGFFNKKG